MYCLLDSICCMQWVEALSRSSWKRTHRLSSHAITLVVSFCLYATSSFNDLCQWFVVKKRFDSRKDSKWIEIFQKWTLNLVDCARISALASFASNRKLHWLHARMRLRARSSFRLRKSTRSMRSRRFDFSSRERQRVDSDFSRKTIARKSFENHWLWTKSSFLSFQYCVSSSNVFSSCVYFCWTYVFSYCMQYIHIDIQYQLKDKKWKNCRRMSWFVVSLARVIERLRSKLRAKILLWFHANFENVFAKKWRRCKYRARRKELIQVDDCNANWKFSWWERICLRAINLAFACKLCISNIASNITKLTTMKCLRMFAMYSISIFAQKEMMWEMNEIDIRRSKSSDISLHAKMSRRTFVNDKFYRHWYLAKYQSLLSLEISRRAIVSFLLYNLINFAIDLYK